MQHGQYNMVWNVGARDRLVLPKMLTNQPAWHEKFSIFLRLGDIVHCGVKLWSIYIYIYYPCLLFMLASPLYTWAKGPPLVHLKKKKKTDVELALNHYYSKFYVSSFWLQSVNDLHALISPSPQGNHLPLILLGKVNFCWLNVSLTILWFFLSF